MSGCPVCRASFRGIDVCPRCGAGLGSLMAIAARAWRLRASARRALLTSDFAAAHELSAEAQRLHATHAGHCLLTVAALCAAERCA